MTLRTLVVAAALAAALPAPAAAAAPEAYTRADGRVERGVLEVGGRARAVVRFPGRRIRERPPRAEIHLHLRRQPRPGVLYVTTTSGRSLAETSLPGRGRKISVDVTALVRARRPVAIVLRRERRASFATSGRLRPRLVLRRSSAPPPRTPPTFPVPPAGSIVAGAAGDVACSPRTTGWNRGIGTWTDCRQETVARLLEAGGLDALLALGDLQYPRGELADFRSGYGASWGRLLSLTRPVIGNHEYETPGGAGYWDYFGAAAGRRGEGWYSFELGAWHVVALNTNCAVVVCSAGSPQERWLRADLTASRARCTLAIMHQPRFTSGPNENGLAGFPELTPLWNALHEAGVELVVGAHMHNYERFPPMNSAGAIDSSGPASFVVGTGGRNLAGRFRRHPASAAFSARDFGYLRLVLHSAGYEWRFVAEPGRAFADAGDADCR